MNTVPEYVTIDELMKLLKIGRTTINRWRKEGMPSIKIGRGVRFILADVMDWIEANKKKWKFWLVFYSSIWRKKW